MRPWVKQGVNGQNELCAFYIEPRTGETRIKRRSPKSFCNQLDLLSLRQHALGRDVIERVVFGDVDSKGAIARDLLLTAGPTRLSAEQRSDFARFLMSLEARRPAMVSKLRAQEGFFADQLSQDAEVLELMRAEGLTESPVEFFERAGGVAVADRVMLIIQKLTDSPDIGRWIVNANWIIFRVKLAEGSLLLSDRPLIRVHGLAKPGATFVLPLTPQAVFVAAGHQQTIRNLAAVPRRELCRKTNISSVSQAERFVFSTLASDQRWIGRYLKRPQH
jgi:hypothetical protein